MQVKKCSAEEAPSRIRGLERGYAGQGSLVSLGLGELEAVISDEEVQCQKGPNGIKGLKRMILVQKSQCRAEESLKRSQERESQGVADARSMLVMVQLSRDEGQ